VIRFPLQLRCPHCHAATLRNEVGVTSCASCGTAYPHCGSRPVLLRQDNPLFHPANYPPQPPVQSVRRRWRWLMPSPSLNLARERVLDALAGQLRLRNGTPATVLVVGAGLQRDALVRRLGGDRYATVLCTDIDVSADVDFYADAHELPCVDGSIDVVVTTAVLEHVLDPNRVAAEITRVLRIGGLLYSELPFMQQVHEGAYDFTRYTLSGHRRLFNRFREIDAGMVAGPGTALLWSLEHFTMAFYSGRRTRLLVRVFTRLVFSWVKLADYWLVRRPAAMDGASCTYLFAERMDDTVGDDNIIQRYVGGRYLSHT
jgi:SAM-dependent methyltransferase